MKHPNTPGQALLSTLQRAMPPEQRPAFDGLVRRNLDVLSARLDEWILADSLEQSRGAAGHRALRRRCCGPRDLAPAASRQLLGDGRADPPGAERGARPRPRRVPAWVLGVRRGFYRVALEDGARLRVVAVATGGAPRFFGWARLFSVLVHRPTRPCVLEVELLVATIERAAPRAGAGANTDVMSVGTTHPSHGP